MGRAFIASLVLKGKNMISAEALAALSGLEHGARYNSIHTVARELRDLGYAYDDWGYLAMSELGRRFLRRGKFDIVITGDDNVANLITHAQIYHSDGRELGAEAGMKPIIDPMTAPHRVNDCQDEQTIVPTRVVELLPEEPPQPLPVAQSRMQEMLRAAGVASGKTGTWVDAAWLVEFIRALDEGGVFSEAKSEDENTP
jgi:hypothetical protein